MPPEPPQSSSSVMEVMGRFWLRFERFSWDVLGVLLLAVSALTALALLGLTQGTFISPWGSFLKHWTGAGSYAIIVLISYFGITALRHQPDSTSRLNLGRVLALEGLVFVFMALLALFSGLSLERAEAGQDGGVIGWGLARLITMGFPLPWGAFLLYGLLIWFVLVGTGIGGWIFSRIEAWLVQEVPDEDIEEYPERQPQGETAAPHTIPVQAAQSQRIEQLPPLTLLVQDEKNSLDENRILAVATKIEKTLAEFGIPSRVVGYRVGPTVTQFAVEPGYVERIGPDGQPQKQKVRVSQISALTRDLSLSLAAERIRIEAPVPGHSYVGIEVPNTSTALVRLRAIIESPEFQQINSRLAIALGRDVSGQPVVADLMRMPHMLVAGTTGSGKSVCLAAIITCLAMNNSPENLRLAILDPKMVELMRFNGLPHIMGKVETQIERMLAVLKWALAEMDQRYKLLESARSRDLASFNRKQERRRQPTLPYVVVLVDELADLMMAAPDQTEHAVVRLAQMARAVGIHLVVATQRPSTDVVTGLIKANFPARVAFSVASSIDSRVILDVNGAESLLGRGDMLFLNPEVGTPQRAQGVLLKDQEIDSVVEYWKSKQTVSTGEAPPWEGMVQEEGDAGDELVNQAVELVTRTRRASASLLQRRLRIGFPRAARLLDQLEEMGIVGPPLGGGKDREVLVSADDDEGDTGNDYLDE
ncbi:MAG: DNA translocase FtsK [Bellilinea sp.]